MQNLSTNDFFALHREIIYDFNTLLTMHDFLL